MSLTPFASRKRALGAAATLSLAVATVGVALAPLAGAATAVTATLSQTSGPVAGGNSITITTSAAAFNAVASNGVFSSNYLEFQWAKDSKATCSAKWQAASAVTASAGVVLVDATSKTNLNVLTTKKAVVKIPAPVLANAAYTGGLAPAGASLPTTSQAFLLCDYTAADATTGTLIVGTTYTVAPAPTLAAQNAATPGVAPVSGPALGGGTLTLTGTNLSGNTVVKLGGTTLTPLTINLAGTQITAPIPAQPAGAALDVTVTTTGGTVTRAGVFTYTNGIVVSPNTAPTLTSTDLDISGVGFSKLAFGATTTGATPDNSGAHVYIVSGTYNPADNGGVKTLPETGECVGVLVVSDTELICTLNTTHAYAQNADPAVANGTYTITVVGDGRADVQANGANANANYTQSIVSSGSTFTVAPY